MHLYLDTSTLQNMVKGQTFSKFKDATVKQCHLESLWLLRKKGGAHKGALFLNLISVQPEYRGQGYGQDALKRICCYADVNSVSILLIPSGSYGSSLPRLVRWYESFGFKGYCNNSFMMIRKVK
jgi:GNAT superfamily N-acetyltransferase